MMAESGNSVEESSALPVILALDTSSRRTSIAAAKGPHLIASRRVCADEKRSERLWAEVSSLLDEVRLTINEIDLYSVCTGPGGFTGLRVGIAAIKGFAIANRKVMIGVTSLEAVARIAAPAAHVLATVNAYKGEAYSQLFSFDEEGLPVPEEPPVLTTTEHVLDRIIGIEGLRLAGDWATENAALIMRAGPGWSVNSSTRSLAESVAEVSFKKYARSGGERPEEVRACYVRPSEAEVKLSAGLLGSKIKRVLGQE